MTMISLVMPFKPCARCKEVKPASEFNRDPKLKSGLQSWCRPCMAWNSKRHYRNNRQAQIGRSRQWALDNPERCRARDRRRRFAAYGITEQQFDEMLEDQGGCCAICKSKDNGFAVDHCHNSGAVRGILCQKCNKGIGLLGDDPNVIIAAARYLERSK